MINAAKIARRCSLAANINTIMQMAFPSTQIHLAIVPSRGAGVDAKVTVARPDLEGRLAGSGAGVNP